MDQKQRLLVVGTIVGPHGVRGEVRVQLALEDVDFLGQRDAIYLDDGEERRLVPLERFRPGRKDQGIAKLAGVDDRDEAESLRGSRLLVDRSWAPRLEADEYYVEDIVGLSVITVEGEGLGRVSEVIFTGSNEVYVVRGGPHGEVLLPAIADVIEEVDLEAGEMRVRIPEGLM